MRPDRKSQAVAEILCPSGPAHADNAVLIGVLLATADGTQIVPTERPIPVTQQIVDLALPRLPDESDRTYGYRLPRVEFALLSERY